MTHIGFVKYRMSDLSRGEMSMLSIAQSELNIRNPNTSKSIVHYHEKTMEFTFLDQRWYLYQFSLLCQCSTCNECY